MKRKKVLKDTCSKSSSILKETNINISFNIDENYSLEHDYEALFRDIDSIFAKTEFRMSNVDFILSFKFDQNKK